MIISISLDFFTTWAAAGRTTSGPKSPPMASKAMVAIYAINRQQLLMRAEADDQQS